MLAVLASTSKLCQRSHLGKRKTKKKLVKVFTSSFISSPAYQSCPKIHHLFITSWTMLKGITTEPTMQSATASEATK